VQNVGILKLLCVSPDKQLLEKAFASVMTCRISAIILNPLHPAYQFLKHNIVHKTYTNPFVLPELTHRNQFYRCMTGAVISGTHITYNNSNDSITTALPRLFCFDRDTHSEDTWRQLQSRFVNTRRWKRISSRFNAELRQYLTTLGENFLYTQSEFADLPHPKRALRRQGKLKLDESCAWRTHSLSKVKTKLKTGEYAKPGKKARNIVDLGVEASLIAGRACEVLKDFISRFEFENAIVNYHGHMSLESLTKTFQRLIKPPDSGFVFEYFSDDSCFAASCRDGTARFNVDFASCDSSHYGVVFDALETMTSNCGIFSEQIAAALKQLSADVSVRDCYGKKIATVSLNESLLFSGSTLTTIINNLAQLMLAVKLTTIDWQSLTVEQASATLRDCARRVGYSVTIVDASENFCKLQFLKYSPDIAGVPYINPGVFLRVLGWSKRDIPKIRGKRTSYTERANSFEASKIESFKYSGQTSLFRIMAEKYNICGTGYTPESYFRLEASNSRAYDICDSSVMQRYGLTHLQLTVLKDLLRVSAIGSLIRCEASDIIFNVDYGYPIL